MKFLDLAQKFRQMYADLEMWEGVKESKIRDLEEAKSGVPEIEGTFLLSLHFWMRRRGTG